MTQTVGKVYAEALFLLAQEEHAEKRIFEELDQVAAMMAAHPDFVALLDVPAVTVQERVDILRKVIGEQEGITENFLCLLIEKHRIRHIGEICEAFNKLYFDAFRMTEVFVTTAAPLSAQQKEQLKEKLHKKLGREILLRETVDASLLGGMVVQYGDTRMDNSLRTRMQQFRQG